MWQEEEEKAPERESVEMWAWNRRDQNWGREALSQSEALPPTPPPTGVKGDREQILIESDRSRNCATVVVVAALHRRGMRGADGCASPKSRPSAHFGYRPPPLTHPRTEEKRSSNAHSTVGTRGPPSSRPVLIALAATN